MQFPVVRSSQFNIRYIIPTARRCRRGLRFRLSLSAYYYNGIQPDRIQKLANKIIRKIYKCGRADRTTTAEKRRKYTRRIDAVAQPRNARSQKSRGGGCQYLRELRPQKLALRRIGAVRRNRRSLRSHFFYKTKKRCCLLTIPPRSPR